MIRLVLLALASSCSSQEVFVTPEPSLERMLSQPRYDAYEASGFFADGRTMQAPPEHTVPVDAELDPGTAKGYVGDHYVERIPVPVDLALVQHGRERFDVYCAPCHGIRGDGVSVVAGNMSLVTPRSLLIDKVRSAPDGRIYRVIDEGYGLMASYATQLSVTERWAVVAYVRALQLAQRVRLSELPEGLRRRAEESLR